MLIGRPRNQQNLATSPSGGLNGVPSVRSGTGRCFKPSPVKTKGVEFKFLQALIGKTTKQIRGNHNERRLHLWEETQVNKKDRKKTKNKVDTRHTSPMVWSWTFFQINGCTLGVDATKCPAKSTRKLPHNNYVYPLI